MAKTEFINNGPAAAAVLASGIGSFALGLFTTLAEASTALRSALNLYNAAGPLSGKTSAAVLIWLISWALFHGAWKNRHVDVTKVFIPTFILIGLGLLGTFPPFFELFGG